jgi:Gas vesicle synthesis protein GvpL/GvpF
MLLYCMTEVVDASYLEALSPGVAGAVIESLAEAGVRCFYSRVESVGGNAERFRSEAQQFHAVLRQVLDHAALVPFRFPTLVETEQDVYEFLAAHAAAYLEDLKRLRGRVQMEIRIRVDLQAAAPPSGKAYMECRVAQRRALEGHAEAVLAAIGELITQWQVRNDGDGLRCYALLPRERVATFEERMRRLSPVQGATLMVSGPWPASEFLHVRTS